MSIPVNLLRFAGSWSATTLYSQYDFVLSPIDSDCYVYIGDPDLVGGADPSVPNPVWVRMNPPLPAFPTSYGSFSSTQTQPLAGGAETLLTYDTADIAPVNVGLTAPANTEIAVQTGGVYKVVSSLQCNKTAGGGSTAEIDMYPKIGGVAVPNSATKVQINNAQELCLTVEWFLAINAGAGNGLQVACFTPAGTVGAEGLAVPAAPPVPAIPSIITTILRIA